MRIAVVTTSWPDRPSDPSGHFVRTHAGEIERDGHAVVVFAPPPGGAFGWPGAAARIRQRPLRALEAAGWIAFTLGRVRAADVDRVVAHWCVPCGWPIGTASGVPLEIVSHGGDVRLLTRAPAPVRRAVVRALVARAVAWSFASEDLRAELLARLDPATRAGVERIAVVKAPPIEMPNVDFAIAARRRELGDRRVAVCVGRLVAAKRVDRIVEHVARDESVRTLVVVGDGPERVRLERLVRSRGIDVRFVGNVDRPEALAWIGAADVLIHASEAEGLSTVIREAEALGTAVIRLTK
jgi:glycosyltransferase involved in cell wall biosynthesis